MFESEELAQIFVPPKGDPSKHLRIGVHDTVLSGFRPRLMTSTLQALKSSLGTVDISVHTYSESGLIYAALKNEVDLFIVSSGLFTYLERSGASVLASLKSPHAPDVNHAVGSVFFTRADDARYEKIEDLRSAMVAAVDEQSFSGWFAALGEVMNVTQYPKHYFGKTSFYNSSPADVVKAVLNQQADVGILPTCVLESLISRGIVSQGSVRIVNRKEQGSFGCMVSTRLYPDYLFAARADIPSDILKKASAALLSMPINQYGYGWTAGSNLTAVRNLMEEIGYVPTQGNPQTSEVVDRYKYALVIGTLLLLAAVFYSFSVSHTVAMRTRKLREVIDEKSVLEKTAKIDRERFSQIERAGFVSEISSMIAHELRQPVASLINYADGLALHLSGSGKDPIVEEATREIIRQSELVSSIVERVRAYAKNNHAILVPVDLCQVVKLGYNSFRSGADLTGVRILSDLPAKAMVLGDDLELELLVVNCMKNALQAVHKNKDKQGEIRVRIQPDDKKNGYWRLEIEDNGPKISPETLKELSHPVSSDKIEGLGLGLCITRVIAERHRARLEFREAGKNGGLIVSLCIAELHVDVSQSEEGQS